MAKKVFFSSASLAERIHRSQRAVQAQLKLRAVEPDAELILAGGRRVALFEEKTLAVLIDQKQQEKL